MLVELALLVLLLGNLLGWIFYYSARRQLDDERHINAALRKAFAELVRENAELERRPPSRPPIFVVGRRPTLYRN